MANLMFPWITDHLAKYEKPKVSTVRLPDPARNGCTCPCHDPDGPAIMHFMDCCPADPKPSTLAQQVASAQAEVATWPEGKLTRVKLAGGDQP